MNLSKPTLLAFAICLLLVAAGPLPGHATDYWGPLVSLHATPHALKGERCDLVDNPVTQEMPCLAYELGWPLSSSCDIYLVVTKVDPEQGVAALSCGILYNGGETGAVTKGDQSGVDVYSWTVCASGPTTYTPPLSDPDAFPASGGGIRITWDAVNDCQRQEVANDGVNTVAGVLYVYAYTDDVLMITRNVDDPQADWVEVEGCDGIVREFSGPLPAVEFGNAIYGYGRNPCIPDPVTSTSWSRLKTTYE